MAHAFHTQAHGWVGGRAVCSHEQVLVALRAPRRHLLRQRVALRQVRRNSPCAPHRTAPQRSAARFSTRAHTHKTRHTYSSSRTEAMTVPYACAWWLRGQASCPLPLLGAAVAVASHSLLSPSLLQPPSPAFPTHPRHVMAALIFSTHPPPPAPGCLVPEPAYRWSGPRSASRGQ